MVPGIVQAMYQLSSTARQLAEQKATLEGQRRAHLAWSGQAMVSNSLNVMQEAVETIRAAFLLPQKDLKCACHSYCTAAAAVAPSCKCNFCLGFLA